MKVNASASDYANSKGGNLCTVRMKHKHRHQYTLGVSGEVVLEVTAEESKCLLMTGQQNSRQIRDSE